MVCGFLSFLAQFVEVYKTFALLSIDVAFSQYEAVSQFNRCDAYLLELFDRVFNQILARLLFLRGLSGEVRFLWLELLRV